MRILVVDDDLSVRAYMKTLLESLGVGVSVAATVAEAKQKIASERPDGCIIDLVLDDGNGTAVATFATELGIPLVFASAVADEHNINQMLRYGWVVPKPVREQGLRRIIDYFEKCKEHADT